MDLWTSLKVVARQWVALVAGLALTATVLVFAQLFVPNEYSVSERVIVITTGRNNDNPLTRLNSSSALAAAVAVEMAGSAKATAQLRALGGTADHQLTTDPNLPIVTLTASSTDPRAAARTAALLPRVMNDALRDLLSQPGAPESTGLQVQPLENATSPVKTTSKIKVLGLIAALGVTAAISLAFVAEAVTILGRRLGVIKPAPLATQRPIVTPARRRTPA
jgi:hypothetical protein